LCVGLRGARPFCAKLVGCAYNRFLGELGIAAHRRIAVAWTCMASMKFATVRSVAAWGGLLLATAAQAQPAAVTKTNPLPVYMHYMPWFETPQTLGGSSWGYHWKFNNKNPNIVDAIGRRQIASHYYPLIGPYASRDPDVIEYHMLLMKYSGVDGVLIDWYGQQGSNSDVGSLLTNSNALVGKTDDFGLKFGVIMEDYFSTVTASPPRTPDINKAKVNMAYLKNSYFNNPQYIRQNAGADRWSACSIKRSDAGAVDGDSGGSRRGRRFSHAVVRKE
jgi:hypothetical protein